MPLSEYEQRILEEIERRLAHEDPRFAREVAAQSPYGQSVRKLKRASLVFGAGFALLVAGIVAGVVSGNSTWLMVLGLAAFLVMLGAIAVIATTAKRIGRDHVKAARAARTPGWFARMEERWRQRFDRGEGS
jgi:hypothetical protein